MSSLTSIDREELWVEKIAFTARKYLSDHDIYLHDLKFREWREENLRHLVMELHASVIGNSTQSRRIVSEWREPERNVDYLLAWWNGFWINVTMTLRGKAAQAALWLATRWPARWQTVRDVHIIDVEYRVCPHLPVALPKDQHVHLFWIKTGDAA